MTTSDGRREASHKELFLEHLPEGARTSAAADADLHGALEDVLAGAQQAWPELSLSAEEFIPFLAERMPPDRDPGQVLAAAVVPDLYLACACLRGDIRAVEAFQSRYFPEMERALRRLNQDPSFVQDVQQMIYVKVFVGTDAAPPRIMQYSGQGSLSKWLQVTAIRAAQNLLRSRVKERQLQDSDEVADLVGGEEDPELHYIKLLYRREFNDAFKEALGTLTSRERNILRYRLLEGMAIQQICALFRVHRSTVTRWIASIRQQLLEETERALGRQLRANQSEVASILRVMRSQLDASVRRLISPDRERS